MKTISITILLTFLITPKAFSQCRGDGDACDIFSPGDLKNKSLTNEECRSTVLRPSFNLPEFFADACENLSNRNRYLLISCLKNLHITRMDYLMEGLVKHCQDKDRDRFANCINSLEKIGNAPVFADGCSSATPLKFKNCVFEVSSQSSVNNNLSYLAKGCLTDERVGFENCMKSLKKYEAGKFSFAHGCADSGRMSFQKCVQSLKRPLNEKSIDGCIPSSKDPTSPGSTGVD